MPGPIDLDDDQGGNGSGNGQGTDDRTTENSAEQGESSESLEPEIDLETSDPFPIQLLPPILARQAIAISELGGWPLAMTGPLVLGAASAAIGRGVRVQSFNGHLTRANIYVLIGKQSGGGGTSAYNHALAPLQGFQFRNRREHESGLKPALEAERMVKESEIDNLRSSLRLNKSGKSDKKAISGEERGEISEKIGNLRAELQRIEKELAGPLFIASDCTPEGMARLLTLHGETLFHTDSDAGDALAAILGRYKQDSESSQTESLWLKSYSGESIVIGRKKEGLLIIEEPCLAVLFLCTPERVRELFAKARLCEAGLLPRFHVVDPLTRAREIPEELAHEMRKLPSEVSQPYEAAMWAFLRAYRIEANEKDNQYIIDMEPEARLRLIRYFNEIVARTNNQPNPFEARHAEQATRLALIHHLWSHVQIELRTTERTYGVKAGSLIGHETDLTVASAEAGIQIQEWCVRRQAQFLGQKEAQDQETIWTQFHQRMKNRPHFTVRDLYSSQNVSKAEAEALFSLWERNGWILRIESKEPHGRGRPPSLHRYRFARIFAKL